MRKANVLAALIAVALSFTAAGAEPPGSAVGSDLPPKLRGLLIQEMAAVLDATKAITEALVRGDDATVAAKAQAVHDSFIMQQQMTAADREALINTVPPEFIQRDRAFHEVSAELAQAARDGNKEQQMQIFTDMLKACTDCHAQHATDRFPEFQGVN